MLLFVLFFVVTVVMFNLSVMKFLLEAVFKVKHHSSSSRRKGAKRDRRDCGRKSCGSGSSRRRVLSRGASTEGRGGVFARSSNRCMSFRRVGRWVLFSFHHGRFSRGDDAFVDRCTFCGGYLEVRDIYHVSLVSTFFVFNAGR